MWEDYSQTEQGFFSGEQRCRCVSGAVWHIAEVGRLHKGVSELISGMANEIGASHSL